MTTSYLSKKVLIEDFEEGTANVIEKYGCPYKVLIAFDSKETCDQFIETYNGGSFEETID